MVADLRSAPHSAASPSAGHSPAWPLQQQSLERSDSFRRRQGAEAACREPFAETPIDSHACLGPGAPIDAQRAKAAVSALLCELVKNSVRRRVIALARRPENPGGGSEQDEAIKRIDAGQSIEQPAAVNLRREHARQAVHILLQQAGVVDDARAMHDPAQAADRRPARASADRRARPHPSRRPSLSVTSAPAERKRSITAAASGVARRRPMSTIRPALRSASHCATRKPRPDSPPVTRYAPSVRIVRRRRMPMSNHDLADMPGLRHEPESARRVIDREGLPRQRPEALLQTARSAEPACRR